MIVDKLPLPDDPTPADAPPSYDALVALQPEKSTFNNDKKSSPTSPIEFNVKRDKGKSRTVSNNWFNFSPSSSSRTSHEIRNTVQGLLRDLVQDHASNSPAAAAVGILNSCADACETHGVSFSDLLQRPYVEQHTPLYWAIVKRLPDDHPDVGETQGPDLLTALISFASPLKDETITEIRQACLATSDQNLFKRLGQSPGFARMSAVDQMLLGVKIPPDEIEVEEVSADEDAFVANFVIPQFHKRMAVSKQIPLEFIARGRLWCFKFLVAKEPKTGTDPPAGSWCISLSLEECSPPTHVDSRLLILEAAPSNTVPDTSPPNSAASSSKLRTKSKASIIIVRLQTNSYQQLEAYNKQSYSRGYRIVESLDNVAAKLQYPNNPYIDSDEKLRARFEARLGKADKDCVIC